MLRDFLDRRRSTLDPPRFQGWGRRRSYFEGWYYKLVVPERRLAYALIPGISYGPGGEGHAFLQVLDGVRGRTSYHRYGTDEFTPARGRFHLRLGPHEFSAEGLSVALPELTVEARFTDPHPWPRRPLAPGVMGWYGFVPRMQCYHGLVSLHHELAGRLADGAGSHDLGGGAGYVEKDWGSGFPRAWVWLQSNHLSGTDRPASLMASVAHIPWLGTAFTGFLATLLLEGRLYTFTTWTGAGARVQWDGEGRRVILTFTDRDHELRLTTAAAAGGTLRSPVSGGGMAGKISESLTGEVSVELLATGLRAYAGTASWAGVEVSEGAERILG